MAATPDPVGAGGQSPEETMESEPVHPSRLEELDPYPALDRDALRGAIQDREDDLASARKELYAARDELAATALDLRICREALAHREADLAGTREELHELLDRHAHLALTKDILEKAIGDRETDLAGARRDAAAAIEQGRRSEERVSALEAEVRTLQDAARHAKAAPAQATPEALPSAQPIEVKPISHWDDIKFFLKFMFNINNSYSVGVEPSHRVRGSDGTAAEVERPRGPSTKRGAQAIARDGRSGAVEREQAPPND